MPNQVKSKAEFAKIVGARSITVVDFYADWCGPCKVVAPEFERLAGRYPQCQFIKVNVDDLQDVAAEYSVSAMPTFQLFRAGKLLDTVVGADMGSVESKLKKHLASSGPASSGTGYRLGDGKKQAATAMPSLGSLTTEQWAYLALLGLILYLIFNYNEFTR